MGDRELWLQLQRSSWVREVLGQSSLTLLGNRISGMRAGTQNLRGLCFRKRSEQAAHEKAERAICSRKCLDGALFGKPSPRRLGTAGRVSGVGCCVEVKEERVGEGREANARRGVESKAGVNT